MRNCKALIIGGGIGGLTAAIALRKAAFDVDVIERDPSWSVYGVGIIQQSNVVRAMTELGLLDDYLQAAFGFDHVEIYSPTGQRVARIPSPKLAEGYPANVGIARPALHKVLGDRTIGAGAKVRLGVTAVSLEDQGDQVAARLSDGTAATYDFVVAADGLHSTIRERHFPEAPEPEFTGQAVWRYNLKRPPDLDSLRAYMGPTGIGLVPLSADLMYMYVTTPAPGNPHYERAGLADVMVSKLAHAPEGIRQWAAQICDDDGVVYRPLEWLFLTGPWHRGRIVLLGDAVHATTPHLGQGAGMAIEDSIVLADELLKADTPEAAFKAFRDRRFDRCRYIVEASKALCDSQLGKGPPVDMQVATREMFEVVSAPI